MKRAIALTLILALCLAIAGPALASEGAAGTGNSESSVPVESNPAEAPAPAETGPAAAEPMPSEDESLPPELAAAVQSLSPAQLRALVRLAQERLREMEKEREKAREKEQTAKPKPKPKYEKFKGRVKINGKELKFDQPPVVRGGRLLVPLRAISEGLKAEVRWDPAAKTVTVVKGDTTVVLFLDKAEVLVNGEKVTLDVPAVAVNGRTLVPLRFLNQVFRNRVEFDDKTGEVNIEEEEQGEEGQEEEEQEAEAGSEAAGGVQEAAPAQPEAAQ